MICIGTECKKEEIENACQKKCLSPDVYPLHVCTPGELDEAYFFLLPMAANTNDTP